MTEEKIIEAHKHYRKISQVTTATIIVFSSAILGWVAQDKESLNFPGQGFERCAFYFLSLIPLFIAIFSGVLTQYFIFTGYLKEAKEPFNGPDENKNKIFHWGDNLTHVCVIAFLFGFLTIFVFISIKFIKQQS